MFRRASRSLCILVVLALLGAACSSTTTNSVPVDNLPGDAGAETADDADGFVDAGRSLGEAGSTTSIPNLAFLDDPGVLRVGLPSLDFVAPYELDESDVAAVLVTDLLTDGLTELDTTSGLVEPALADSWSVSDDNLVWTFELGEYVFGDGSPITADDVVFSLNSVASAGIDSLSGPALWPIAGWTDASLANAAEATDELVQVAGLEATDADTVTITLTEPFAALPDVLAGVVFGVYPEDPVETGDLPIASARDFEPTALWEDGFRVQRRDDEAARIGSIEVFIDDAGTLLEVGEVDMTIGLDPSDPLGDLRSALSPRSAHLFFAFDASEAPFDDVLLRQAVLRGVDVDALQREFFGDDLVMQSFGTAVGSDRDRCGTACDFDVDQARLLVEASPNRDTPITVDYFLNPDGPGADGEFSSTEQDVAESVAEQLRSLGLDATAQGHDPAAYGTLAATGELGLFIFGSVTTAPSPEVTVAALFASNGYDNITGISIDRVDEAVGEARLEPNALERAELYADAEIAVFGDAGVLPLVTLQHHLRFTDALAIAGLEPDGSLDLNGIEFAQG